MSAGGTPADDADLIDQLREALGSRARNEPSSQLPSSQSEPVPVEESSDASSVAPADDPSVPTGPVVPRAALDIADAILGTKEPSRKAADNSHRAPAAIAEHICLIVAGEKVLVPPGGVLLGRLPGPGGVTVANSHISRRHMSLMPTEGGVSVSDLGSTNGTVIVRGDDHLVAGPEPTPIRS